MSTCNSVHAPVGQYGRVWEFRTNGKRTEIGRSLGGGCAPTVLEDAYSICHTNWKMRWFGLGALSSDSLLSTLAPVIYNILSVSWCSQGLFKYQVQRWLHLRSLTLVRHDRHGKASLNFTSAVKLVFQGYTKLYQPMSIRPSIKYFDSVLRVEANVWHTRLVNTWQNCQIRWAHSVIAALI